MNQNLNIDWEELRAAATEAAEGSSLRETVFEPANIFSVVQKRLKAVIMTL